MGFKVSFGKGLVWSTRCIFLHIKHSNVWFTGKRRKFAFIILYIKQQNEILNVRRKRLDFDFMILSDCLT